MIAKFVCSALACASCFRHAFLIRDLSAINVLDLSVLVPGAYGLANLAVSMICQELFQKRVKAKRRENLSLASSAQRIWLLIDEAQRFVLTRRSTLSKEILIAWAKEGRQLSQRETLFR